MDIYIRQRSTNSFKKELLKVSRLARYYFRYPAIMIANATCTFHVLSHTRMLRKCFSYLSTCLRYLGARAYQVCNCMYIMCWRLHTN